MNINTNPIGVFDSGVGGISVLRELKKIMPNENYIFFGDCANAPYGTKSEEKIMEFTVNNIDKLISAGAKAIVIACNTATSVAAKSLREQYNVPIIGIEPALKPAAINHPDQIVVVMATPITLQKEKFIHLMENYADTAKIIPLACPGLPEIIERGVTDGDEIDNYLKVLFSPFEEKHLSAIVLGCTHYPFIKKSVRSLFDYPIDIIDGGYGTARETKRRLEKNGLISTQNTEGYIKFCSSINTEEEINLMKKMFIKEI